MSTTSDFNRLARAWLDEGPSQLSDAALDAALEEVHLTRQRRALRAPWRFSLMTNTMRAAAGIAFVAIVGVGVLALTSRPPGAGSGTPAPSLTATPAPTAGPPTASPAPSEVAPGIAGWTTYTSDVYGITFGYPDHWEVEALATRAWKPGDGLDWGPSNDIFISPDGQIALAVFRVAAEPGVDIGSREGLGAYFCELDASVCEPISDAAEPMCLGRVACRPAAVVSLPGGVLAYFADTETRMLTVVTIGQPDSYPEAAQYGGSVQLTKSILTTMDVWTPGPGQIP